MWHRTSVSQMLRIDYLILQGPFGGRYFPLQGQFMSTLTKAATDQEQWDMILFWSGQIAPIFKHRKAAVLMRSIVEELDHYSSTGQWKP
jgi:hypothetical protein